MVDRNLEDAFNDCIDRLANGATVADCLRDYPQYAARLSVMLETGLSIKRAQPIGGEISYAQDRVEARLLRALEAPRLVPRPRRRSPLGRLIGLAATLLLVFGLSSTLAAQSSLPGDALYGLKRTSENVVASLAGTLAEDQFAQRRIDEIQQLLTLKRAEVVTFRGDVQLMDNRLWLVAGLPLVVNPDTTGVNTAQVRDRVEVSAFTTPLGELIATEITLLEDREDVTPTPTVIATEALTSTPEFILTPSDTPTLTDLPTNTPIPPSITPSVEPPTITATPPATDSTASGCLAQQPDDWVSYAIRSGDTLSGLAGNTGTTVEEVMTVNCIEDARFIIAGQSIFLPRNPSQAETENDANTNDSTSNNSGSSNSGSSGSSSSGNDNDDNDDSGGGDDVDD